MLTRARSQLPKCLRAKDKCLGVGDGPAAGRACRSVYGACASAASVACAAKCGRGRAGGDADAEAECLTACTFAACRRDDAVLACRAAAAVAQQSACALERCRADFALCLDKRCGLAAALAATAPA